MWRKNIMKKRNERMKKWIKKNKVFIIIFLLALIIRMIFIIKYPLSKAQHDVNGENGHFSYIQTIFIQNILIFSFLSRTTKMKTLIY